MSASASAPVVNGLKWLRQELDAVFARVRQHIEQHLDAGQDKAALKSAIEELRQAEGALLMARALGPAIMVAELRAALLDCAADTASRPEETLAAVSGGSLQLSDYLDALLHGQADRAAVLQPVIGELRLARGKPAVTEIDLFVRQMQLMELRPSPSPEPPRIEGSAGIVAAKLLPVFQTLLLQWLKNQDPRGALEKLRKVCDQVAVNAVESPVYFLWSAAAAACDSLLSAAGPDSLELKRWFGRTGQHMKLLAERGEAGASEHNGESALRLIAHAAALSRAGPRWQQLARTLPLDDSLPVEPQLSEARIRLRGLNTRLLERVASEVKRDLGQVKDDIDLAVRAGAAAPQNLKATHERMTRVAQTLSLLGLNQLEQVLANQARNLLALCAEAPAVGEGPDWLSLATVMLGVEHSLDQALYRPLRQLEQVGAQPLPEFDDSIPHSADLREGSAALLREMLVDLAKLKSQLDVYLKGGELRSPDEPAQLLNEVAAGFAMLSHERAAILAARLESWLKVAAFPKLRTDAEEAERFADAIAALEMYVEALRDALPNTARLLDDLGLYIERLRFVAVAAADEAGASAASEVQAWMADTEAQLAAGEALHTAAELPEAVTAAGDDPEIRAIFMEEAEDVRVHLSRGLPAFKRQPGNPEALTDIRRAFHTLKGSGRMVGAAQIGEFGWAVEHLLNRCLDGALPVNNAVVETVDWAVSLLPELVSQFARNLHEELEGPRRLIARAHFLASGRAPEMVESDVLEVFREDALDRLKGLADWLGGDPGLPVDQEVVRALHTLKGSAAVVNAEAISQLAGVFEASLNVVNETLRPVPPELRALLSEALPELRSWIARAGHSDAPQASDWLARVAAVQGFLPPSGERSSAARRENFAGAAYDQVQQLEQALIAWMAMPQEHLHRRDLMQASEVLQALALEQDCTAIASACGALIERLRALGSEVPASAFFQALAAALEQFYQWLDRYREGALREDGRELAAALRALPANPTVPEQPLDEAAVDLKNLDFSLDEAVEEPAPEPAPAPPAAPPISATASPQEAALAEALWSIETIQFPAASFAVAIPAAEPVPELTLTAPAAARSERLPLLLEGILPAAPSLDPEMSEIFASEAQELLASLRSAIAEWRDSWRVAPPEDLPRVLHTLKGSARMAGYEPLGAAAHWLENLLHGVTSLSQAASAQNTLENALPLVEAAINSLLLPPPDGAPATLTSPAVTEPVPEFLPSGFSVAPLGSAATQLAYVGGFTLSLPQGERQPEPAQPLADVEPVMAAGPAEFPAELPAEPAPEWLLAAPAEPPAEWQEPERIELASAPPEPPPVYEPPAAAAAMLELPLAAAAEAGLDSELVAIFVAEAAENLETIGGALHSWSEHGEDGDAVRELQRALHTLKGGARMSGFLHMGDVAHELETQAEQMARRGADAVDHPVLRQRLDELEHLHDAIARGDYAAAISGSLSAAEPQAALPDFAAPASEALPAGLPEASDYPLDAEPLQAVELAAPETALPATPAGWRPELFWKPPEDAGASTRRELARVPVEALDLMLNEAGEISIYRSRLEQQNAALQVQLKEMTQTITRLREQLRQLDIETENQIVARGLNVQGSDQYGGDFDPLEMDRYSRMQELSRALAESVGDLSSLHSSMDEVVDEDAVLLQAQSRVNTAVQQGLMGTLMVPFSRQVARLQRVVRQAAQEEGKQAEALFTGIESELDRNVLERMTAPLEHLLRNAVVHGLEGPIARAQAGKPAIGVVQVALRREGTQLLMEIGDDGRGLNFEAIRNKAIERGLMPAGAQLADEDVAQFIFEPGFSTASQLTQIAGRGVGMDVVASEVKQLGGTLELRSRPGQGARFFIRLPLSLALSQALMVSVGGESYALPLTAIEGIARVPRAMALAEQSGSRREGRETFAYGGHDYRVRHLSDLVELPYSPPAAEARTVPAVLVRLSEGLGGGERRAALIVDVLLGNREIVSKSVGPQLSSISGVAGATILPNGQVVLILDPAALIIDRARRKLIAEAALKAAAETASPVAEPVLEGEQLIMVVDDSITMRRVAERLLVRQGYRVITAKDGLDAIAQLQTETPSAILLDIEMPRADGFEVAGFVRNASAIRETPIIMITSRSGEKHRARAATLGVNRYLIKPYQEDQLLAEIRSVMAEREASRA